MTAGVARLQGAAELENCPIGPTARVRLPARGGRAPGKALRKQLPPNW